MKTLFVCLALLVAAPSFAADDIDFRSAQIVYSPSDLNTWPATAKLTSVAFRSDGWKLEFDRRKGPGAWPNFTIPTGGPGGGPWEGPMQYTVGMCLNRGGWKCSAVVQMWRSRLEEEGFAAGGAPEAIAETWFYDTEWGVLYHQQPAPNELVGVFVMAADGRRTYSAWPGALRERSDVRLVRWGESQVFSDAPTTGGEGSTPAPSTPTTPSTPMDLTGIRQMLTDLYAQNERIFAAQNVQFDATTGRLVDTRALLERMDKEPGWLMKVLENRYVQLVLAGAGAWIAKQEIFK